MSSYEILVMGSMVDTRTRFSESSVVELMTSMVAVVAAMEGMPTSKAGL